MGNLLREMPGGSRANLAAAKVSVWLVLVLWVGCATGADRGAVSAPVDAVSAATSKTASSRSTASKPTRKSRLTAQQKRNRAVQQAAERQERQCVRYRKKLERIEQQLDAGYREPKGNRLRQQRRELQSTLFRECR